MKYLFFQKITAWIIGFVLIFGNFSFEAQAQVPDPGNLGGQVNTVFTSIPFLRINPDARTGAMGDVGLATSPDPGSMYHNASKLAFAPNDLGLGLTYTPWLRALVNDIYIAQLAGYKRINDLQTLALSMRYFSLGNIQFTGFNGEPNGQHNPNEFAFDLAYARKLSDNFSAGITLKYVRSDLANGQEVGGSGNIVKAANAVAADVSFYFEKDIQIFKKDTKVSFGTALTNIGNKVSYTEDDIKDFIPINLGMGTAFAMDIDDHNSVTLAFDMNKLLVPTPNDSIAPDSPDSPRNKPLLSGMFGSFADAPGGFKEEMQEIMYSVGFEYWYNKLFAIRLGYFHEHANKGDRKYVTTGVGVKYSVFGLNFSYIIPASGDANTNPLNNTLRFSLLFDFDGKNAANEDMDE